MDARKAQLAGINNGQRKGQFQNVRMLSFVISDFASKIHTMRLILCILGSLLTLAALSGAHASQPVDRALESLRNPDPRVRADAAKEIEALGVSARPQLVRAAQSHDRLIAGQAAEMLMKLPFHREDDPAAVRALLADYHLQTAEQRQQLIAGTILRTNEAANILCRLMNEDPDNQVAWFITQLYGGQPISFWKPLLDTDLTHARPAVKATAARGVFFQNRPKAIEILKQVVQEEEDYPTAPSERVREIYLLLAADAQVNGGLAEAQRFRRVLAEIPSEPQIDARGAEVAQPSPLTSLLAFYAGTGVIAGFGEDLVAYWQEIPEPECLYGLSRVFERPGLTPIAAALERLGDAALPKGVEARMVIAEVASQHQWVRVGLRLHEQILRFPVDDERERRAMQWRNVSNLYAIAKETGDDAAAIRYSQQLLELLGDLQADIALKEIEARMIGHQIHLARSVNDRAQLQKLTNDALRFVDSGALDADSGAAVVNAIADLGDKGQAKAIFQKLYQQHQSLVVQSDDASRYLNNLAWLCAGVGMNLDIAVDAAERASRAEPTEFGTIDTAATAHFRAGNIDRATELETFALALHPNDRFLLRQLEMFKAARK